MESDVVVLFPQRKWLKNSPNLLGWLRRPYNRKGNKKTQLYWKKTYGYLEREEGKIEEFKLKISQIHPDDRVHIIFTSIAIIRP